MLSSVQPPTDFRREGGVDRRRRVPICLHERLSRSSATALPMASGSSLYPLGIWKNSPSPRLTSLATTRLGPGFGITGTSFIVPSKLGSYAKTCPAFAFGSRTRCRSSTVNVFMWGHSHWTWLKSSFFFGTWTWGQPIVWFDLRLTKEPVPGGRRASSGDFCAMPG